MPLSPEQIARIRGRSPGWEADWALLFEALYRRLEKKKMRGSLFCFGVRWRDRHDIDDFVGHMLAAYGQRAQSGELLVGYRPETGTNVLTFLASASLLRKRALTFLARQTSDRFVAEQLKQGRRRWDGNTGRGAAVAGERQADGVQERAREFPGHLGNARSPSPESLELAKMRDALRQSLSRLRLAVPGKHKIARQVEQAGLQLYPRLDWSAPDMDRLRGHLERVLVDPAPEWPDRFAMLGHFHNLARQRLRADVDDIAQQRLRHGNGAASIAGGELGKRQVALTAEMVFMPLSAKDLQELLGIPVSNAEQLRSRYRRKLPELLPELWESARYIFER